MHTNFLNIRPPKEKCTDEWWEKKTVINTGTTTGLLQQVHLLVIKLRYWANLAVINPQLV